MKTINERWKEFERAVVNKNAGEVQRMESKRMFFAGAATMFDMMTAEVSEMSDDGAMIALDSLRMQICGFGEAVRIGGA